MAKQSTNTSQNTQNTQTATPSAYEQQLDPTLIAAQQQNIPQAANANSAALNAVTQGFNAFMGGQPVGGYMGQMMGGITPEQTQSMSQQALKQLAPQMGQGGILNSGVAANVGANVVGDIYRNTAQSNIENWQNTLSNLFGGNAQTQGNVNQQTGVLSSSLAGLRTITGSGSGTQVSTTPNPFMNSFATNMGKSLGNSFGVQSAFGPFNFGG